MLDFTTSEPILFYGHTKGIYCGFSNFYPAPFTLLGVNFCCSEQAYVYGKSEDPIFREKLLTMTNPYAIKGIGGKIKLRSDWPLMKYDWMVVILKAKFSQNLQLRDLLLFTGDRPIHENSKDVNWGGGPNFPNGKDLLGKALMETRTWLRLSK